MPRVHREVTLNARTRRLQRMEISDQIVTDREIDALTGQDQWPFLAEGGPWRGPRTPTSWTSDA